MLPDSIANVGQELQCRTTKHYRSSIRKEAQERIVSVHPGGQGKHKVELILDGKVVGFRQFDANGELEFERPMRTGVTHGTLYYIDDGVSRSNRNVTNSLGIAGQFCVAA